jgi:hypothetical protein
MNLYFYQTLFLLVSIVYCQQLLAHDEHVHPSWLTSSRLLASVKRVDSVIVANNRIKVCACEILHMRSSKWQEDNIAVFSEKTMESIADTDFSKAKSRLTRETNQLRVRFFNRITRVMKTAVPTDCRTLYRQLQRYYEGLILFEVLDADIEAGNQRSRAGCKM